MKKQPHLAQREVCALLAVLAIALLPGCGGAPSAPEGYTFIKQPDAEIEMVYIGRYTRRDISEMDPQTVMNRSEWVISGEYLGPIDTFLWGRSSEIDNLMNTVHTKGLFKVEKIYKGNYEAPYIEAVFAGGAMPLEKYIEGMPEYHVVGRGLSTIPAEARAKSFIRMSGRDTVDPVPGETYLLCLNNESGEYWAKDRKYALLPMREDGWIYSYQEESYIPFSLQ